MKERIERIEAVAYTLAKHKNVTHSSHKAPSQESAATLRHQRRLESDRIRAESIAVEAAVREASSQIPTGQ